MKKKTGVELGAPSIGKIKLDSETEVSIEELEFLRVKEEENQQWLFNVGDFITGGTLSVRRDNIKFRIWENQTKLVSKAKELISNSDLSPISKPPLKLIKPIIEYGSLEEDESLRNAWSSMLANALTGQKDISVENINHFQALTALDVLVLDRMYNRVKGFKDPNGTVQVGFIENNWFNIEIYEPFSNIEGLSFNDKVLVIRKLFTLGLAKQGYVSSDDIPSNGIALDNAEPKKKPIYLVSNKITDNFAMTLYGFFFVEKYKFEDVTK
jgi:hypothetical protein